MGREKNRIFKNISYQFTKLNKMSLLCNGIRKVVMGVIIAIVASLCTNRIIEQRMLDETIERQIDAISGIYIGCTKEWADEAFGKPQFSGNKGEYSLYAYISDFFVVQFMFDQSMSAQGYLITKLPSSEVELVIDEVTTSVLDKFTLGELSYLDFGGTPYSVFSYAGNGNERILYSETYYFIGNGNYYNYHIATLDFGELNGTHEEFSKSLKMWTEGIALDEEFQTSDISNMQLMLDRKSSKFNSYGVSNLSINLDEYLFTYKWFNSQQLRNRYHDVYWRYDN